MSLKDAIKAVIENDMSIEVGVHFYQCHSGEYVVCSESDHAQKYIFYQEFEDFDSAYQFFKEKSGIKEE